MQRGVIPLTKYLEVLLAESSAVFNYRNGQQFQMSSGTTKVRIVAPREWAIIDVATLLIYNFIRTGA